MVTRVPYRREDRDPPHGSARRAYHRNAEGIGAAALPPLSLTARKRNDLPQDQLQKFSDFARTRPDLEEGVLVIARAVCIRLMWRGDDALGPEEGVSPQWSVRRRNLLWDATPRDLAGEPRIAPSDGGRGAVGGAGAPDWL